MDTETQTRPSMWLRNKYGVDFDDELISKVSMLKHNYACAMNILKNPGHFPRANFDAVEKSAEEHGDWLMSHGYAI